MLYSDPIRRVLLTGIAPDGGKAGLINIFSMQPTGVVIAEKSAVQTADDEYPKSGKKTGVVNGPSCTKLGCAVRQPTLSLHISMQARFTARGTRAHASLLPGLAGVVCRTPCTALIARVEPSFSRHVASLCVEPGLCTPKRYACALDLSQHAAPAGIFFDNLVFDWAQEDLYYVTFNDAARTSSIAKVNSNNGNLTYIFDITKDIGAGLIYPGQVSICSTISELYVGVDAQNGEDKDFVLRYDVSGANPVLKAKIPLFFPIPTSTFAICNATALDALYANTIQVDGFDRETALLGDVISAGTEGLFYPVVSGDLPSYNRRGGAAPKYFNGMIAEFGGEFVLPAYEPYEIGLFPHPGGLVWNVKFSQGPVVETLTPIEFFLAGASGVPGA